MKSLREGIPIVIGDKKGPGKDAKAHHTSVLVQKEPVTYDLSGLTIMVAEDSHSMQTLISSMLRSFGVGDVLVCDGGREAQNLLQITEARKKSHDIRNVDIIITDWLMEKGSGVDLIEWVRNHDDPSIQFLPIILVSAYTTEKVVATARDRGAHEALVKPLSGHKLAGRIISVIDNPRSFIKTPHYFGPDRRRQDLPYKGKDKRKKRAKEINQEHIKRALKNDG